MSAQQYAETLKACAHCGGSEVVERREVGEPLDWFFVQCLNEECGAKTMGWGLRSSARKAWNRRASEAELVSALREAHPMISDHAAGGRRLTRKADASALWTRIQALIAKHGG